MATGVLLDSSARPCPNGGPSEGELHGEKGIEEDGGEKGRQLEANASVALCFYWHSLDRQVRIESRVEKLPREETIRLIKVLVHDETRVLLLHRRPERGNFWQPITGSIESGESANDAASRELHEETGNGAVPEAMNLTQSFMIESQYLAARYPLPIIASEVAYTARLDSALPIRMDAEEHDEYGWFTFAEAYERIKWSDDREALEQLEIGLLGC